MRSLLVSAFLVAIAATGCARPGTSFDVTQNGLHVRADVHRDARNPARRKITISVTDASSGRPLRHAQVGIEESGITKLAHDRGNGMYEIALLGAPGTSGDVTITVLAGNRASRFEIQHQ